MKIYAEDGVIPFPDANGPDDMLCVWVFRTPNGMVMEIEGPERFLLVLNGTTDAEIAEVIKQNKFNGLRQRVALSQEHANSIINEFAGKLTEEQKEWHRNEHRNRISRLRSAAAEIMKRRKSPRLN